MHTPQSSTRRIRIETVLVTLAVVAMVAVVVRAARQDAPQRGPGPGGLNGFGLFMALDTDGQPGLSAAEIDKAETILLALDKNGDGQITGDEVPAPARGGPRGPGRGGFRGRGFGGRDGGPGRQGREDPGEAAPATADDLAATLMTFDQNEDGKLTRTEVPARMQGLFDRGDTNKDGELFSDEITHMAQSQQQAEAGAQGREGRGGREGRLGRGGGPFGGRDPLMRALDTDQDGALSAAEAAKAGAVLRGFDRDADGLVQMQEVFAAGAREGRR